MPERQYMIDDLRVEDTWRLFHIISFILINRAYWKDLIQWLTQKVLNMENIKRRYGDI